MGLMYDFSFAELAVEFLKTGNVDYLHKLSRLDATDHILNHATQFRYDVPTDSKLALVTHLLTPIDEQKRDLPLLTRNLIFAKSQIANSDIAEQIVMQYLPAGFNFSGSLYFTIGYDIGVAYGKNCSLNLAHPIFLERMDEIKYYAIHELHHVGFVALKGGYMPSLDITTRKEMTHVIEYLTHLEGMGTFAALGIREDENALSTDGDYIALLNLEHMRKLEQEYFDIYNYYKNSPNEAIIEEDWQRIDILSDKKRLWYIVGAHMARTIDQNLGRKRLVELISMPSEDFITTYSSLR